MIVLVAERSVSQITPEMNTNYALGALTEGLKQGLDRRQRKSEHKNHTEK